MVSNGGLVCWKCGAALDDEPLPLSRLAQCRSCRASLHVCRMCRFYDPAVARQCREPVAEEVREKERANFCGWFQPRPDAHSGHTSRPAAARAALEALFGGEGAGPSPGPTPGDEPFRKA